MKVLLSLTVLCITVGLGHGACFSELPKPGNKGGCIDPYNGKKYPFGAKWNTGECMECSCNPESLGCCTRYGGVVNVPGCKAVVDPKTCKYKFYKADDPSKPCPGLSFGNR